VPATGPRWSSDVAQADWIAERLAPFHSGAASSVVPAGFEAYARLLHPALGFPEDGPGARWAEVAAWSGLPLERDTQFHDLALSAHPPPRPAPWAGRGAEEGTLDAADLAVLIERLAEHTSTPEDCWFCIWEGYGWDGRPDMVDPIPPEVRAGPRVQLPHRRHLLHHGPITAARAFVESQGQSPTLWWPTDRAWCVGTELDLSWTYVAGSRALITRLLADARLEAQAIPPDQSHHLQVGGWLAEAIARTAEELMSRGEASLVTWRGTMHAELSRPGGDDDGSLRVRFEGEDPVSGPHTASGWTRLRGEARLRDDPHDEELRRLVTTILTRHVVGSLAR
jgi:hypothetical protein